jgi:phage terminase large subunit GpA-like protein
MTACPNCGGREIMPMGWRANPYGLYWCPDCRRVLWNEEGKLRVSPLTAEDGE